jgi:hypothetical protein
MLMATKPSLVSPLQTTCIDGIVLIFSRCYERFFCRMQHHGLPCQGRLGRSDRMGDSSKHCLARDIAIRALTAIQYFPDILEILGLPGGTY